MWSTLSHSFSKRTSISSRCHLILTLFVFLSFSVKELKSQSKDYQINCEIKGIDPGSTVFLLYIAGNTELKTANANASPTGKVQFILSDPLKPGTYKLLMQNQKSFNLLISHQQQIDVSCELQNPIATMQVLNDDENKYYYQYLNTIEIHQGHIDTLKHGLRKAKTTQDSIDFIKKGNAAIFAQNTLKNNFNKAHPFPILSRVINLSKEPAMSEAQLAKNISPSAYMSYYKDHFLDNVDFNDSITLHLTEFQNKLSIDVLRVTKQDISSVWKEVTHILELSKNNREMYNYLVPYFTFCYDGSKINGMDEMFVKMANNYFLKNQTFWKDSFMLYRIQDRVNLALPLLNGHKLPPMNLLGIDEMWHSSDEGTADYTIVVFFDPDCKHCIKDLPILKEYYDQVHPLGVNVYAVCIGPDQGKWKEFIEAHHLDWVNVADFERKFNLLSAYDVNSYPQFYLLDKEKNILAKKIDVEVLKQLLDSRLGR